MRKWLFFLLLVVLVFSVVGCKKESSTFDIYGTAVEAGTNIPLADVAITIGSTTVKTDLEGNFKYEDLAQGNYQVNGVLEGYDSYSKSINLTGNLNLKVELTTQAPLVNAQYVVMNGETLGDEGLNTDDTIVNFSGNLNDILTDRAVGTASTSISIEELLFIVNGAIYRTYVEPSGSFNQDIPVDPGSNVIQLRVIDSNGYAGTSNVIRVTVSLARLDIRAILKWDTDETDVDLHLFKRQPGEQNPVADSDGDWWGADRHVCYYNASPSDFGATPEQNPFLDIDDTDGYGPETIVLQEATNGLYHVWVHYYDAYSYSYEGDTPTNVNVRLVINGGTEQAQVISLDKKLTTDWEFWYLGYIEWPSGQFVAAEETSSITPSVLERGNAPIKMEK